MKEKREQLQRCYDWLKQEPNDIEVLEKVKELEEEINKYDFEKEKQQKIDEILSLEKEIRSNQRCLNSKIFDKNEDLRILKLALDDITISILKRDIERYNTLVAEFKEKYM